MPYWEFYSSVREQVEVLLTTDNPTKQLTDAIVEGVYCHRDNREPVVMNLIEPERKLIELIKEELA